MTEAIVERRSLVARLLREHLLPHGRRMAVALVWMALAAASIAALPLFLQTLTDMAFAEGDPELLHAIAGGVVLVFILRGLATYFQAVLMSDVGRRIVADLQSRMFARLMANDIAAFHAMASGTLMSRFVSDVTLLNQMVSSAATGVGLQALSIVGLVAAMFVIDWQLALIIFLVIPAVVLPVAWLGRRMRRVTHRTQEEIGQFNARLSQVFQGIRQVKAYTAEAREIAATDRQVWRIADLQQKTAHIRSVINPIMETLAGVAIAAVIVFAGEQVMGGTRTPGVFFGFVGAVLLAYQPMRKLANLNAVVQQGLAATERLFDVIDLRPSIVDRPDAKAPDRMTGAVSLVDVDFAYHPGAPALDGVSIEIPAGHTVALVGPSGAGKSTVLNLIPRFYDVDGGSVRIDDVDIRDLALESLRRQIALVSQEVVLFDDTVRANIAYGRPDADEAAIRSAAEAAAAADFIQRLPEGYDTRIGEHGVRLSGGQRQRLSIARAMLKDAPILLLDEATAALDTESERLVQQALSRLKQGRTTLVIAHRLSTVTSADTIYVMDRGRVIEQGNHASLIAAGGLYARLWSLQTAISAASDEPQLAEAGD